MKSLHEWSSNEIMEWICEEHDKCNKCYERFPLKNFKKVTNFVNMTRDDFVQLAGSKEDGEFLFERKQMLLGEAFPDDSQFKSKKLEDWTSKDIMFWIVDEYTKNNMDYELIPLRKFANFTVFKLMFLSLNDMIELLGSKNDGEFLYECKEALFTGFNKEYFSHGDSSQNHQCRNDSSGTACPSECSNVNSPSTRRPGRPRTKTRSNVDKAKRCGKLWEFLRNLLMDSSTCPSLIKWDNYNEGTFKFVQSEKVAKLWGDRKNNGNMNYEKFSRAMRYYYRSQVLLPVSGKRLVYKFGPNATGWKNIKPIL